MDFRGGLIKQNAGTFRDPSYSTKKAFRLAERLYRHRLSIQNQLS